jgi:hypothetical protein
VRSYDKDTQNRLIPTSNIWATHVSRSAHIDMDTVVDTFETVTGASAIPDGMIAEGRPVVNTSQHIVYARSEIRLRILKNPRIRQVILIEWRAMVTNLFRRATLSVAPALVPVGCRRVVLQLLKGSENEESMGWKV